MSKQTSNTQIAAFTLPVSETSSNDAGKLIKKYVFHWPLFLLGAILALIAAYFYIQKTEPVYPILATLEFKTPTSSEGTVINKNGNDQQLDPINKPVIVENEIEVMQSKKLMYQVVNDLQLWVSYVQEKSGSKHELYKNSPVKFKFVKQAGGIDAKGEKLMVVVKNNSFVLKDDVNGDKAYNFSTPIKSSFGTWMLEKTAGIENYIGSTINIKVQDPDLVSDSYQANVKVSLENKDAPFVNLSTSDQIPARGKDILNSLMDLYQKDAILDKGKETQNTLNFIDFRLDSIKKGLNAAEVNIEQYKSNQGMTDIISQAQGFRDIKQANIKAQNDVAIQLKIIEGLDRWANSPQNSDKLPATSAYLQDPSLMTLYDKLSALQLQRQQLLATTPETNPMFDPINRQISTLKTAFKEKIRSIKSSLLATQGQMNSFDSGIQTSLKKIPDQDRKYNSMKREQESKERIYTFLLEKKEQVALRYASSISDSEVVDDAHAGKAKWPKPAIIYPLALILGMAAAAGILYGREAMNEQIMHRKQIEDAVSVPILGELSYQESTTPIVVSEGRGKFAIGEQFRVLRTNLFHLHGNNESGRVTLFTSSIGGEGKSFVSSNLAVTLAYAKRKTIILEMDLRKPKISGVFNLSPDHPGISDFLAENTSDLSKLIQPSGIPDLDVLGCGPILPNPSELLEKSTLDLLISKLKETYDDILIDSPPIHLVTDALIIARVANASVYMVRQGYTNKEELEFIKEINESNRLPKYSLVFNGIKKDNFSYSYGYSYGYSNSYYNSYSEKEKTSFGEQIRGFFKRF